MPVRRYPAVPVLLVADHAAHRAEAHARHLAAAGGHFDRIAKAYNSSLPSHVVAHYLERRAALIRQLVPPPGPVLDAGCGTGLLGWKLSQLGYAVAGLDESRGMLLEAPRGAFTGRLVGDATRLPFKDGALPGVVTVAMLHHIAEPGAVAAAIKEMVRVTAPGGAAVIWDHNPLNPYWPLLMRRVPQDEEHTRLVPLGEILSALEGVRGASAEHSRLGWVPDFVPAWSLGALRVVEHILESVPGVKALSAHNVVVVRKQ